MANRKIKRALISVSDKTGLELLVPHLKDWQVEVIASGGTRKHLESLGLAVTPIESVTGNPEAFSGRMKTLSFQVASSLLYRRDDATDCAQAQDLGIQAIDLLICNLYPFEETLKRGGSFDELIEQIDIGGPTMIRAAAKNFDGVCVCTNPHEYQRLVDEFHANGETSREFRLSQAKLAFAHSAHYETAIANYFNDTDLSQPAAEFAHPLRYGENPQQAASILTQTATLPKVLQPIQGKALSYNNVLDLEAAIRTCLETQSQTELNTAVIIKHNNPCGVSAQRTTQDCLSHAWACDPVSAFGSVIACSYEFGEAECEFLSDKFVEIIAAPSFSERALTILAAKKNLRLIRFQPKLETLFAGKQRRTVFDVTLEQEADSLGSDLTQVTKRTIDDEGLIQFGIAVTKQLKSNAITLVHKTEDGYRLIGAGMGNPNRLLSIEQAVKQARDNGHSDLSAAILISDAFFPFADNIELAHGFGINQFVQPGGSIKDQDVIDACDRLSAAMVFTGRRHFLH